jgi:hypothetical protein
MERIPGSGDRRAFEMTTVTTGWLCGVVTDDEYHARLDQLRAQQEAGRIVRERSAERPQTERTRRGGER